MGYGENYLNQFTQWFGWLDRHAQDHVEAEHPEPEEWLGFYTRTKANPWPRPERS